VAANAAAGPNYRTTPRGRTGVRIKEATVKLRFIPRLLAISLMLAFVATGLNRYSAGAAERIEWTDTVSIENALVQSCYGFNITGSYTANRAFQLVEDYTGRLAYERQDVTFAGALGNTTSGKSYAYDGAFTRVGNPVQNKVMVSNLSLRFEVGTPGEFTVSLDRVDFDLSDNPHMIVKTLLLDVLQMDLCQLFASPPAPDLVPSFDDRMVKDQSVIDNTESSALNPPPNYLSGDSTVTCDPRKGYPQDCAVLP
jgi:hypothetical protein